MKSAIDQAVAQVGSVVLGKERQIRMALACLLSRGHLLIEDLPGVGKTTLAHALAQVLGLDYQRVQFTSDMLPGDMLGTAVYETRTEQFRFHKGPVFTQLLLADEINRSTPKTQSALLEAMEERQVTIEGDTWPLPEPFFVIATQNPVQQSGTFPLPESQLDRFLMRIHLGYPTHDAEKQLLLGGDTRAASKNLPVCIDPELLGELAKACGAVKVSDSVVEYLLRLVHYTRESAHFSYGVSPRAALALLNCAKTWAYMDGRQYLVPDDIQLLLEPVLGHRLRPAQGEAGGRQLIEHLLQHVDVVG